MQISTNDKTSVPFPSMNQRSSLISSYYASELIPNYKDIIKQSVSDLKLGEPPKNFENEKEEDDLGSHIENSLKKKYNFIIPAIQIDLKPTEKEQYSFRKEELSKFFSSFGEITYIDIPENSNKAYLLYKYYFSALYAYDTMKEILSLSSEDNPEKQSNITSKMSVEKLSEQKEQKKISQNKITPIKLNYANSPVYIPKKYLTNNQSNQTSCGNFKLMKDNRNRNFTQMLQEINNAQQLYNIPKMFMGNYSYYQNINLQMALMNFNYTTMLSNAYNFKLNFPQKNTYKFHTFSSREYVYKYVCNYEVQIENDEKFNVTKRIIGQNGVFLKKIIYDSCISFQDYSTKVRLRGKGSGYREGEEEKESEEPLQLCVSSLNYPTYLGCCRLIEQLLMQIYFDYFNFLFLQASPEERKNLVMKEIMKYEFVVNRYSN